VFARSRLLISASPFRVEYSCHPCLTGESHIEQVDETVREHDFAAECVGSAMDPATLLTVALGLALVAMTACYLPARRVLRIEPAQSLRE